MPEKSDAPAHRPSSRDPGLSSVASRELPHACTGQETGRSAGGCVPERPDVLLEPRAHGGRTPCPVVAAWLYPGTTPAPGLDGRARHYITDSVSGPISPE